MELVTTERQLRQVVLGTVLQSWDRLGPCPAFIESPAVLIEYKGVEYLVFTTLGHVAQVTLDIIEANIKAQL